MLLVKENRGTCELAKREGASYYDGENTFGCNKYMGGIRGGICGFNDAQCPYRSIGNRQEISVN